MQISEHETGDREVRSGYSLKNMAKKCDLCGRGSTKGASRSHSKIKTLRRQNINLQSKNVGGLKVKVCTSCLRTMDKPKRIKAKCSASAPKAAPVKKAVSKKKTTAKKAKASKKA